MLDINMEFNQGILFVRLRGILNGDTIGLLKKDLDVVIRDNGIKYVLINLNNLSYIDSYGLEAIKLSYRQITNNNGKLIICGINKLFEQNKLLADNLYQVSDEVIAYELVNI